MAIVSTTQDQRPFIDGQWEDGCEPIEVSDLAEDGVFARVKAADGGLRMSTTYIEMVNLAEERERVRAIWTASQKGIPRQRTATKYIGGL